MLSNLRVFLKSCSELIVAGALQNLTTSLPNNSPANKNFKHLTLLLNVPNNYCVFVHQWVTTGREISNCVMSIESLKPYGVIINYVTSYEKRLLSTENGSRERNVSHQNRKCKFGSVSIAQNCSLALTERNYFYLRRKIVLLRFSMCAISCYFVIFFEGNFPFSP